MHACDLERETQSRGEIPTAAESMLALCLAAAAYAPSRVTLTHIPTRVSPIVASESLAVTNAKSAIGLASQPVAWASLFTFATTGCGLRGELAGTLEGVAYVVIAGWALGSLYVRATTGLSVRDAELQAADAELEVLEASGATAEKMRASVQKAEDLAGTPASLLGAAETLSYVTAVAAILVFGAQLIAQGSLPSAVPNGGACWS